MLIHIATVMKSTNSKHWTMWFIS